MFMTVEEMYAFKSKYEAVIEEAQRKLSVIDEFIAFAEAKGTVKSEPETENEEENVVFDEVETADEEIA